jgi:hypothetical protein
MEAGALTHGKYTIDLGSGGCSVYTFKGDQKVFLCGGIADPELAMAIVEGLLLVEAKKFYAPDAARTVTVEDGETVPPFLKRI